MKFLITTLNGIALALAAYLIFAYGQVAQILHIIVFGMAIASIHGLQKKSFYIATLILNIGYLILGIVLVFVVLNSNNKISLSLQWFIPMVIMYILVPAFNSKYVFNKIRA